MEASLPFQSLLCPPFNFQFNNSMKYIAFTALMFVLTATCCAQTIATGDILFTKKSAPGTLNAIVPITPVANYVIGFNGASEFGPIDLSGTYQPLNANLTLLSGGGFTLNSFALTYLDEATAGGVLDVLGFSAFMKTLVDDDAPTARTTLGVPGLASNNTFTGIQTLSDTTNGSLGAGTIVTSGGIYAAKNIYTSFSMIAAGFTGLTDSPITAHYIQGSTKIPAPGMLVGFRMETNASDPSNDIDIEPGMCTAAFNYHSTSTNDNTDAVPAVIDGRALGTLVKKIDATFTAGNNGGGLDYGTPLGTATYHVHAISTGKTSAALTDYVMSLSHDESSQVTMTIASPCVVTWGKATHGHGLVDGSTFVFRTSGGLPTGVTADTTYYVIATGLTETTFQFSATPGGSAINSSGSQSGIHWGYAQPKMPSGYTWYRRIGSVPRVGGVNESFTQDGDTFYYTAVAQDVADTALTTARSTYTLASAPTGRPFRVFGRLVATHATAGTSIIVTSLRETDAAPSPTAAPFATVRTQVAASAIAQPIDVVTDSSGRICARSTAATTTIRIGLLGWIDHRGK